jgi:hypothetical protein
VIVVERFIGRTTGRQPDEQVHRIAGVRLHAPIARPAEVLGNRLPDERGDRHAAARGAELKIAECVSRQPDVGRGIS